MKITHQLIHNLRILLDSPFDLPEVDSNLVVFDLADIDGDGDLDIIGTTYFYSYDTSTIDFVFIENLDLTPVDLCKWCRNWDGAFFLIPQMMRSIYIFLTLH